MRHAAGDRVAHSQYGTGTINRVNEYHTVIDFDEHGLRTFSSPRLVVVPSSTAAPVKVVPVRKRRAKVAVAKTT